MGNLFPDSSTHAPCGFHMARTLSGSLRSPPSPRGEGFDAGKAVLSNIRRLSPLSITKCAAPLEPINLLNLFRKQARNGTPHELTLNPKRCYHVCESVVTSLSVICYVRRRFSRLQGMRCSSGGLPWRHSDSRLQRGVSDRYRAQAGSYPPDGR